MRSRAMVVSGFLWVALLSLWAVAQEPASAAKPTPAKEESAAEKPVGVEDLLLFYPAKHPAGEWNPPGLKFQDVWFAAEDKTKLHGWYLPCEKPRAVVLLAHGNGGNVALRAPWLKYLQTEMRVSLFAFDYRGYGRSEGIPTVDGILQDARGAREKLAELAGVKSADVVLMGESLGGAVVVQLAAESACKGLVLQSTFSSLRDVAEVHYPKLAWLVPPTKLNSVTKIAAYRGPLLQSHGTVDQTIPYALGKKLFEAGIGEKEFVELKGIDHNNWITPQYLKSLDGFIEGLGESE